MTQNYTIAHLSRRFGIDCRGEILPGPDGRPRIHVSGLRDRNGNPLPDSQGRSVAEAYGPIVEECLRRERAQEDWVKG